MLLGDELFPAEQARIAHLRVERVEISCTRVDTWLRRERLVTLMRDLGSIGTELRKVA
jgi:hypothetical protein